MMRTHLTRARLGALTAVGAGVVLGAVFGQPGSGQAASTAVPKNKTVPTISGAALVGQTLTGTRGTWSGNPTSFHFSWSRCDAAGTPCAPIGGATGRTYNVTGADVGHTLRVAVTARNRTGASSPATSAATGVVPPSGCPPGTGTIQVANLSPPAQMQISRATNSPRVTHHSTVLRLSVVITACNGRPVQGATVFATPIPYNQFAAAQGTTGADGAATITAARQRGFPAARHQRLLAVFTRATSPGQPLLGGVSARRVFAFRIAGS